MQPHLIATDKEKDIFFQIIDRRIKEFRRTVGAYYPDNQLFTDLCAWLEELRVELKEAFSEWYENSVRGRKIPQNVVIPKPRQDRIYRKYAKKFIDKGCEVCGDVRVLNIAHIIPREFGGPNEEWNLIRLCANHHYLFDNVKLTPDEWDAINWKVKDERAYRYAIEKRLPTHQRFWEQQT